MNGFKPEVPSGPFKLSNQARWLQEVIPPESLGELAVFREVEVVKTPSSSLCLLCRGGRMLCGKLRCPLIARAQSLVKCSRPLTSELIQGSTPPAVFVGRVGYPRVYVGPMVPPYFGDTEILDTPELWVNKSVDEIMDYRFSLVRGKVRASVFAPREEEEFITTLQELAMGKRPAAAEALLSRAPRRVITLSEHTQPFGPSAPLRRFKVSELSVDHRIERAYYDRDLRAAEAVVELYKRGVLVTRIQRAFSLGMFGEGRRRKLVPTRWSITAVDSILSQELIEELKQYPTIDEYRVYCFDNMDNRFVAILMPERWSFEWIEAWFPGTTWNPRGARGPAVMGDWEPYEGRKTYPDIGGCYYACRLAVAEKLAEERKQAAALALREIHPGYILPVGVWFVRESVRAMLAKAPAKFQSFGEALNYAFNKLYLPSHRWIKASALLEEKLTQTKLQDFI